MRYIKWIFLILVLTGVVAFLHYTLPQRDIVRIVNTYEERQDFGGLKDLFWKNTGNATADAQVTRDVLFIQTVKRNGKVMVYRNQDTGFGWPPYFKFDTADVQTEAADAQSTAANPQWVVVRHYGWRNSWLLDGIFPNALSIRPIDDPDQTLVPWLNIVIIVVLIALFRMIQVRISRVFRRLRGTKEA